MDSKPENKKRGLVLLAVSLVGIVIWFWAFQTYMRENRQPELTSTTQVTEALDATMSPISRPLSTIDQTEINVIEPQPETAPTAAATVIKPSQTHATSHSLCLSPVGCIELPQ